MNHHRSSSTAKRPITPPDPRLHRLLGGRLPPQKGASQGELVVPLETVGFHYEFVGLTLNPGNFYLGNLNLLGNL